jgi:hypothetical protein
MEIPSSSTSGDSLLPVSPQCDEWLLQDSLGLRCRRDCNRPLVCADETTSFLLLIRTDSYCRRGRKGIASQLRGMGGTSNGIDFWYLRNSLAKWFHGVASSEIEGEPRLWLGAEMRR